MVVRTFVTSCLVKWLISWNPSSKKNLSFFLWTCWCVVPYFKSGYPLLVWLLFMGCYSALTHAAFLQTNTKYWDVGNIQEQFNSWLENVCVWKGCPNCTQRFSRIFWLYLSAIHLVFYGLLSLCNWLKKSLSVLLDNRILLFRLFSALNSC